MSAGTENGEKKQGWYKIGFYSFTFKTGGSSQNALESSETDGRVAGGCCCFCACGLWSRCRHLVVPQLLICKRGVKCGRLPWHTALCVVDVKTKGGRESFALTLGVSWKDEGNKKKIHKITVYFWQVVWKKLLWKRKKKPSQTSFDWCCLFFLFLSFFFFKQYPCD